MSKLGFGYNPGLPEGVERAWGARLIVTQDGTTDLVYNRQDWIGLPEETEDLQTWLNGGAIAKARNEASELLKRYEMKTREAREFVLYEDEIGTIKGNTNGSHGYLYICGYLWEDTGNTRISPGLTVHEVSDEELRAVTDYGKGTP